jgi:hypothetical protein
LYNIAKVRATFSWCGRLIYKKPQNIKIMKTSFNSILATSLIALAISTSSVYATEKVKTKKAKAETVDASSVKVSSIKKIIVGDNVEVTISQSAASKVLYTNDGATDVLVKKIGNSLYVNSKNLSQPAKITVYVDDIYRIEASENALVQVNNSITLKYLQVFIKDNAKVDLNANTENLFTSLKGFSTLSLTGYTDFYSVDMEKDARITINQFKSKKTEMNSPSIYVASRK